MLARREEGLRARLEVPLKPSFTFAARKLTKVALGYVLSWLQDNLYLGAEEPWRRP
jgi:hypothetical protein